MPLVNPVASAITGGSYTGDNAVGRAIPHGLPGTPKMVIIGIQSPTDTDGLIFVEVPTAARILTPSTNASLGVTAMDSVNFYVGNATSQSNSANSSVRSYTWVAIG